MSETPLSTAVIKDHFDSEFLAQIGPATLNASLQGFASPGGATLLNVLSDDPTALVAEARFGTGSWNVTISVDGTGLIDTLLFTPSPAATSWADINRSIVAMAPQASFLAARVSNGTCNPIDQVAASTNRPLGSEFKLFVLGAVANQVSSGRVTWGQELTVEDGLRNIGNPEGSGSLQYSPAGTRISVQQAATKMISISDNTAADMLINLVGRSAVQAQVRQWSNDATLDVPFLTTKELFILHYVNYPALAKRYVALSPSERLAYLASRVDPLSLDDVRGSAEPRAIDSIEYFASPDDICRAFGALQRLSAQAALAPLASILSTNPGGLELDRSQWPTVWFKGGSEPGVLTLGYLGKNTDGQSYVVSAMVSNPTKALSPSATASLVELVKGAFDLMG